MGDDEREWERACLRKPELEDSLWLVPSGRCHGSDRTSGSQRWRTHRDWCHREGAVGRMPLGGILPVSVTTVTHRSTRVQGFALVSALIGPRATARSTGISLAIAIDRATIVSDGNEN